MEIKKKIWPEYFELVASGKKKFDIRLADFDLKEGDILILEEYDPKTKKYTGKTLKKKVNFVMKINPFAFNKPEDIQKSGLYGIGIE